MATVIDLTHVITAKTLVYEQDEPVVLKKIRDLSHDKYNDWRLSCGMHAGTHIDGPGHLTDSAVRLSDLTLERFVGSGHLIDARNMSVIRAELLQNLPEQDGLIVVVLTGWDKKFGTREYFEKHPVLEPDFAQELIRRNVKMVGIDFFSPDVYPFEIHKLFFRNGILLIENLTGLEQLEHVISFTIVALPLKTATDSAPARVIAFVE